MRRALLPDVWVLDPSLQRSQHGGITITVIIGREALPGRSTGARVVL